MARPAVWPDCPVELAVNILGGKWKVPIVYHLLSGHTLRFGELRRLFPGATQKMLTQQLRELERDGIVHRRIYPQVPPKVEYSLSPLGEELGPVMEMLVRWGTAYKQNLSDPAVQG